GRAQSLHALIRRHAAALSELDRAPSLVHGDFRAANVTVHEDRLAAVLDWEFAMAGPPLADLGQFLRDEDELPSACVAGLVEGYERGAGRPLPVDFRRLARLRDLLNLLQLLAGASE